LFKYGTKNETKHETIKIGSKASHLHPINRTNMAQKNETKHKTIKLKSVKKLKMKFSSHSLTKKKKIPTDTYFFSPKVRQIKKSGQEN
jgi:hypothetical protein